MIQFPKTRVQFISDFTFSQKRLSRVAGASEAEALQLEIELLVQVRDLHVPVPAPSSLIVLQTA